VHFQRQCDVASRTNFMPKSDTTFSLPFQMQNRERSFATGSIVTQTSGHSLHVGFPLAALIETGSQKLVACCAPSKCIVKHRRIFRRSRKVGLLLIGVCFESRFVCRLRGRFIQWRPTTKPRVTYHWTPTPE